MKFIASIRRKKKAAIEDKKKEEAREAAKEFRLEMHLWSKPVYCETVVWSELPVEFGVGAWCSSQDAESAEPDPEPWGEHEEEEWRQFETKDSWSEAGGAMGDAGRCGRGSKWSIALFVIHAGECA